LALEESCTEKIRRKPEQFSENRREARQKNRWKFGRMEAPEANKEKALYGP
jgi:hypothetical protein